MKSIVHPDIGNVINTFIGFTPYLLFIQSIESGLFETDYFTTNAYIALHVILVFLTDVPDPTYKENVKPLWIQFFFKRGQNDAVNVRRAKFSEAEKTLLTFLICDSAVSVPLQPIVNCCAFILVNYLYLVIVDDSTRLGWREFLKISAHVFGLCCVQTQIRSITSCNKVF